MNNYCKHLKRRKGKPYCNKMRKEITLSQCQECGNKEYKKCKKNLNYCANWEKKTPKMSIKVQNIENTAVNSANLCSISAESPVLDKKSPVKSGNHKIRAKSPKLVKLERNRYSVFCEDKNKCMFCSSTTNLTWHEIFRGANRKNSMEFGFCIRMCLYCHEKYQDDPVFNEMWHKLAQKYFEDDIASRDEFIKIFRKNYL